MSRSRGQTAAECSRFLRLALRSSTSFSLVLTCNSGAVQKKHVFSTHAWESMFCIVLICFVWSCDRVGLFTVILSVDDSKNWRKTQSRLTRQIQDIPISRGSYGHPELCAAPCIRAFYSKCTNGVLCKFCHFGHTKAKVKLFKEQRQLFDSLEEATVLSLLLSLLRDKCKKLPATQQEVMRLLLAALQKRVVHLGQPIVSQDTRRSLQTLKKFSIGRLFEVVEQSRQVDAALKSEVRSLLMGARTMVQRLHARDQDPWFHQQGVRTDLTQRNWCWMTSMIWSTRNAQKCTHRFIEACCYLMKTGNIYVVSL